MIGLLSGKIAARLEDKIILKTPNGIGYLVNVSPYKQYLVNENIDLYILQVFRDKYVDELFGFEDIKDREWVEKLTKVNGVGSKTSANIAFTLGWEKIMAAINQGDHKVFSDIKGLGLKTAKKIVLELKGDIEDLDLRENINVNDQTIINFTDTLMDLGYKRGDVVKAISQMKKDQVWDEDNMSDMVRFGLKYLGKGK